MRTGLFGVAFGIAVVLSGGCSSNDSIPQEATGGAAGIGGIQAGSGGSSKIGYCGTGGPTVRSCTWSDECETGFCNLARGSTDFGMCTYPGETSCCAAASLCFTGLSGKALSAAPDGGGQTGGAAGTGGHTGGSGGTGGTTGGMGGMGGTGGQDASVDARPRTCEPVCGASTPICDPATMTCKICTQHAHCAAPTAKCDVATDGGRCVECVSNADCSVVKPVCDARSGTCRDVALCDACQYDDDCGASFDYCWSFNGNKRCARANEQCLVGAACCRFYPVDAGQYAQECVASTLSCQERASTGSAVGVGEIRAKADAGTGYPWPVGHVCSKAGDCGSGNCVEGVCCATSSCGPCKTCRGQTPGNCAPIGETSECTCPDAGVCGKKTGLPCGQSVDCASGFCVDGVCCGEACTEPCRSCATTPGTCAPVTSQEDVPQCVGERSCSATAVCGLKTPDPPLPLRPWNGETTGSVFAQLALRPKFAWRPAARAEHYELEVDDSCNIASFADCAFPSPEIAERSLVATSFRPPTALPVSQVPPVGRRYFWRLRACNGDSGCSAWSPVRYVDVGRQAQDVNGDGYADITGSRYMRDPDSSRAYVFLGGPVPSSTPMELTGPDPAELFGSGIAVVGDLNADGFADIAVSTYTYGSGGRIYVYLGGVSLSTAPVATLAKADASSFGGSFAFAGDVNADGFGDLAVGASGDVQGGAFIFAGSALGPSVMPAFATSIALCDCGVSFGNGDVNGDGYSDLAGMFRGCCSNTDVRNDTVRLFPGNVSLSMGTTLATNLLPTCGGYQSTVAVGDVDGDDLADVVAGTPGEVRVYRGNAQFALAQPVELIGSRNFGDHVAVGDINGDGVADIVSIGNTGYVTSEGRVYLGGPTLNPNGDYVFTPEYFSSWNQFVSLGDVNGDGYGDFAAYDYDHYDAEPNSIFVYYGATSIDMTRDLVLTVSGP
jgi:hypothetical protein